MVALFVHYATASPKKKVYRTFSLDHVCTKANLHVETETPHAFSVFRDDVLALLFAFGVFVDVAAVLQKAIIS